MRNWRQGAMCSESVMHRRPQRRSLWPSNWYINKNHFELASAQTDRISSSAKLAPFGEVTAGLTIPARLGIAMAAQDPARNSPTTKPSGKDVKPTLPRPNKATGQTFTHG
jgi:hypothetical protein